MMVDCVCDVVYDCVDDGDYYYFGDIFWWIGFG